MSEQLPAKDLPKVTVGIGDISGREFDYVIIGGGTSGLTIATRLSEDASITVAVLESGGLNTGNPSIDIPAQYGKELGNAELAFAHMTVPQEFSNNRSMFWPCGKGLGGSSAHNFLVWQKPPAADIDAWSQLGADGWDWALFDKYVRKAENFIPPPADKAEGHGIDFDSSKYGQGGPLSIGITHIELCGEKLLRETMKELGVPVLKATAGPDIIGTGVFTSTINPRTGLRSYVVDSYFIPNANRPNLKVLTKASVHKIVIPTTNIPDSDAGDLLANGVEFEYEGKKHVVHAKKEVIVSAGRMILDQPHMIVLLTSLDHHWQCSTLASSAILERSGIGNKDILQQLGIQVRVHNPGVGENLQEHSLAAVIHEVDAKANGWETLDGLADPEYAAEQLRLHALGLGLHRTAVNNMTWLPLSTVSPSRHSSLIDKQEQKIAVLDKEGYFERRPGLKEQYNLQIKNLRDDLIPECELAFCSFFFPVVGGIPEKGHAYNSLVVFLNKPFSRGSIHIQSADPKVPSVMDPHLFEHDIDLQLMVEELKFMRKMADTAPYKQRIIRETLPGPDVKTDDQIAEYIKNTAGSTWHTAGSCAMLPKERGGVVDSNLRVYGMKNIRVADLSIIPLHIAAHTQTSAYAIGEICKSIRPMQQTIANEVLPPSVADKIKGKA